MFNLRHNRVRKQTGSSLILVLLFLMLLSAAGMGLMYGSNIDTMVGANYKQSLQAYYASKQGLEEARDRIRGGLNPIPPPTGAPQPGNPAGVVYILNPDNNGAVQPWVWNNGTNTNLNYYDDELCHENFPQLGLGTNHSPMVPCSGSLPGNYYTQYTSTDPNSGTAAAIPYKWVRITLKYAGTTWPWCTDGGACSTLTQGTEICADNNGNEQLLPAVNPDCVSANMQPVYTVTSMALTTTGARRITQQEIANVTVPPLPGALVLDGPSPPANISTPSSNPYKINGINANSCHRNPPGANLTAVGTISNNDTANFIAQVPSNRTGNYTGVDGVTPDVENVEPKLGLWSTVGGLEQITTALTNIADVIIPPSTTAPLPPWGTQSNPTITVVQGDYNGPCNGYGILLVQGALTCNGSYSWTGAVLVIGKGYVAALNGGGSGTITGGFLVANIYDHLCAPGDSSCTSAHVLPGASIPGTDYFNWNGGGGNGIQYDQCELGIVDNKIGYHVLVTREEMY